MEHTNIKKWYQEEFPTDELGTELKSDITFRDLFTSLHQYYDVYDFVGVYDSLVRERLFGKLSEVMSVDYDYIYSLWLSA